MKHFLHDLLVNLLIFHNSNVDKGGGEEVREMVCWSWKNYVKAKPDGILLSSILWKWSQPVPYPYFPEASVFKNPQNPFLQATLCHLVTFQKDVIKMVNLGKIKLR